MSIKITIQVNSRDEISKELLSVIMRQFNNLLSVHLNDDRRSGYAIFASEFDALLAIDTINNRHIANTLFTARIVDMDDLLVSRSSHHHTRGSSYEEADEDSDDDDDNDDDDDEEKKLVIVETTTTTTPVKQKAEEKQKKKSSSSSSSSSKKKSTRRVHRLVSEPLPSPQQQKQQQQQQSKNNSSSNHMSVSQAYMNDLLSGYNITNDPSLCNNTNKRKASNEFAGGSTSSSQTTKKIQKNQN